MLFFEFIHPLLVCYGLASRCGDVRGFAICSLSFENSHGPQTPEQKTSQHQSCHSQYNNGIAQRALLSCHHSMALRFRLIQDNLQFILIKYISLVAKMAYHFNLIIFFN
ncbi:hypothetical protein D3C81_1548530 [compost metagenome]